MYLVRQLAKYFGVGLVTVLPFALVIWVLVAIFNWVDGLLGPTVDKLMGIHVVGVGFVIVIVGITVAGLLMRLYVTHQLFSIMDRLFARIPLVKSLYSMFKDLIGNLVGHRRAFTAVVLVYWPDERAQVLGLLTGRTLPKEMDPTGQKVSVYLPNAFQFAGITVIVDESRIQPCALTVEDALKFTLSAGLGQSLGEDSSNSGADGEKITAAVSPNRLSGARQDHSTKSIDAAGRP